MQDLRQTMSVWAAGSIDTVGTAGFFEIRPNTVNSVPREAKLEIDIRDTDAKRRDEVVAAVIQSAKDIAERRGVEHSVEMINQDPPATCSEQVSIGLGMHRAGSRCCQFDIGVGWWMAPWLRHT